MALPANLQRAAPRLHDARDQPESLRTGTIRVADRPYAAFRPDDLAAIVPRRDGDANGAARRRRTMFDRIYAQLSDYERDGVRLILPDENIGGRGDRHRASGTGERIDQ